jgi:predicted nucleic acid-binding protein
VNPERGLLDTSAVIGLEDLDLSQLPAISAVSALTLAELASGPHAAANVSERARRQERVQQVEMKMETLPFEGTCARAYGRVYAEVVTAGRKPPGPRALDLMIAATALAYVLPLYTLNAADLQGLEDLVEIIDLG